jgi:hypothetical protein
LIDFCKRNDIILTYNKYYVINIMVNKTEVTELLEIFRDLQRRKPPTRKDAYDEAQAAILRVVQAFQGIVPTAKVLTAIGDATSPNAVSRAVRHRLPPLK